MVFHDSLKDLAGKVSLETTDDVLFGEPLLCAPAHVSNGRCVELHSNDDGSIERGVGLSVASGVEPVLVRETRRSGNWTDAAEFRERRFGMNSFWVVAEDDEHLGGDVGTDAKGLAQRGRSFPG